MLESIYYIILEHTRVNWPIYYEAEFYKYTIVNLSSFLNPDWVGLDIRDF